MASKKTAFLHLPILIAIAVVLLVIYIVSRAESPIAKIMSWISTQVEGFADPVLDTPKCPVGFKFFNDSKGESFCCGGAINRYSHTCLAKGNDALCAFKPGVPNPNGSGTVPLCSSLIRSNHATAQASNCPEGLPNYASIGKCCYNPSDLDGYDCSKSDNADVSKYCKIAGPLQPGEQLCSAIRMSEKADCPAGLSKINYTLGQRESTKYGKDANGINIPVCFGMDQTCIPDNVVSELQKRGIYGDKTRESWKYACSGWEKINIRRDLTGDMDSTYV
jgi:hypothetical protein